MEFAQLSYGKTCPEPRRGVSLIARNEKLYIFGGKQDNLNYFNDIYSYNLSISLKQSPSHIKKMIVLVGVRLKQKKIQLLVLEDGKHALLINLDLLFGEGLVELSYLMIFSIYNLKKNPKEIIIQR